MNTKNSLAILLVVILGCFTFAAKAVSNEVLISPAPRVISGGVVCDTMEQVRLAIDDLADQEIPWPQGCKMINYPLAVVSIIYLTGEKYKNKTHIFRLARFEMIYFIRAPAPPVPFVDDEGNEETVIKYGWWGSRRISGRPA